ncbi:chaoptin isoform X1 [Hermetia illucens]|uniref:chaoptin isoform X1 n=1 Tax=Hermetia illucens TaxID=343691 RepID=UPI0018CC429F|nr:chaoptin isoform X1 [Hermetia illucens]
MKIKRFHQTTYLTMSRIHCCRSAIMILLLLVFASISNAWRPCQELSPALRFPCKCNVEPFGPNGQLGAVAMDCDQVVFHGEAPQLPVGAPIISYSQRFSGQQVLPAQAFGALDLPIKKLDFSNNSVRRLSEKSFVGLEETLNELRLANNLLGDSLNPIFSSAEFHPLINLRLLDLSGNKIKSIEEGLLKGCSKLEEFYLDNNSLSEVPSNSINGPDTLKVLSLQRNNIAQLKFESFAAQPYLEKINLAHNQIKTIEGGTFGGLDSIKEINLNGNRISKMNSDVFEGVNSLEVLDLSQNFISLFPVVALETIESLKSLNLSSNMIQKLDSSHLQVIKDIEVLDLSRNGITTVPPGTFRDLKSLKYLDLSLNSLRTIEDDALEGLDSLQTLIIRDNNILLVPGSALGRLPRLSNLYLDYNRVAALSSDILGSIQPDDIKLLSLSRNVIRELPPGSFQLFKNLESLDLSGNSLALVTADIFMGLETSLQELKLSHNKITGLGNVPLSLGELKSLDLSGNNIADIPRNAFAGLENLISLNLSENYHISPLPSNILTSLTKLQIIDLSKCSIKHISGELFAGLEDLETVILSNNHIQELHDGTFADLPKIKAIDLSYNRISSIRSSTFVNVMSIRKLSLKGNQLNAFKGEFFNTGTGLEELDISENELSYLFPSSFRIHPRLRKLIASKNKFSFFPSELITSLQYLEFIDLSYNQLKSIDELDFARLPRLRTLKVSNNQLESLSEMAFHNSTQLQIIDLGLNKLDRIGERTFEGLIRLECLNLEGNMLTELPDTLFERNKLQMLENINLSNNSFEYAPLKSLQRQYFFVSSVDLSHNRIKLIPSDDSIMVNIKNLDLSYNPLSEDSIRNILSEPKTVRDLNLAGTGLKALASLETPFLQNLNLSHNHLTEISDDVFQRSTLLESLDLSNNMLSDLEHLAKSWARLPMLQVLDLSNNSFEMISQGDFDHLDMLQELNIVDLEKCTKIEKNAFQMLPNLARLSAYNYPLLGYLDIKGILEAIPGIEKIDLEVKDAAIGTDQIQPAKHPRLKEIGLRGDRLRSISSGTLAGLKSSDLTIRLKNTSLSSLPPALLFPVPRSSNLNLDITGSKVTVLSPQFLTALEDRRNSLKLKGLSSNPIHCDCNARALRRWLPNSHMTEIVCQSPDFLKGKLLIEVGDDELTCDPRKMTTSTLRSTSYNHQQTSKILTRPTTLEPVIIWSLEPTQQPAKIKTKPPQIKQAALNNDDTLIIGIVGGVVAFIAILIIIICIVRLKMSSSQYQNAPMMGMPPLQMGPGSIPVNYKGGSQPTLYALPPYAQNYATLPHKNIHHSQQNLTQPRPAYSTMGRLSYYQQQTPSQHSNSQPYVIYADEKAYR